MFKATIAVNRLTIMTLCLLSAFLFLSRNVFSDTDKFEGEVLKYNIRFWIFKKAGTVTFSCEENGDTLVVTVDARTTGIFDRIIHRHNIYRTTMITDNITGRLKPVNSYEKKIKGEKERIAITDYDYKDNICRYKIWRNGMIHREGNLELESKEYDDMVSVPYNFRNEIYGKVEEGASFNITTVYKDKFPNLSARVLPAGKPDELSRWRDRFPDIRYTVDVSLDPEVLDSKGGNLVILLTDDLIPVVYVAKDIVGFGDLYGILE